MQILEDLQRQIAASRSKSGYSEYRWESPTQKSWTRRDTQTSLSDSLPPYPTKGPSQSLTDPDAAQTSKVLWYTVLKKPRDPSPDCKPSPSQYSDQFPKVPLDEPSSEYCQLDQPVMTGAIAIEESFATKTRERHSPSKAMNESLPLTTTSTDYEHYIGSTDISNDTNGLIQSLDTHVPKQEGENAPGSVGGLLELEALPSPGISETTSVVCQESDVDLQEIQENSLAAVPEKWNATFLQCLPVKLTRYEHGDFCNDHFAVYGCSCPRSTTFGPPSWFAYFFGALILAYSMPPFFASIVCCNVKCKSKPKRHIRLQFRLPLWLATNTCLSIFYWDNIYGHGSLLEWRKSREIEAADVVVAIEKGDVRWLQRQVAMKELRPLDTLKGVGDPLAVSLQNHDCYVP